MKTRTPGLETGSSMYGTAMLGNICLFLGTQIVMGFFEPLGNGYFLGTLLLTFEAFNTIIRPGFPGLLAIAESCRSRVIIHRGIIIITKCMGYVYPVWTGHAILAAGAGDGTEFSVLIAGFIN